MGYKMRESQTKKIPLTLVLGDKEVEENSVSYRKFGNPETTTIPSDEFISLVTKCIIDKGYNI